MYKRKKKQGWIKHLDFIVLDVVILQISFILAYRYRMGNVYLYSSDEYRNLAFMYAGIDFIAAALFNTMHNVMKRGFYQELKQTLKQVILVLVIITLYLFSARSGQTFSRIAIYLTSILHFVIGYVTRLIWKQVVFRISRDWPKATMILVTDEKLVHGIVKGLEPIDNFRLSGIVLSNRDAAGETIDGVKVVANIADAADYICREWVDEIMICTEHLYELESESQAERKSMNDDDLRSDDDMSIAVLVDQCRQMSIPVHIRLPLYSSGGKNFVEKVGGYDVLTLTSNYASPLQLAFKRLLDILGGIVGSLLALIIMAIVGPMIKKESPGPVLFKQTRVGQNGKKFEIYKIRSMYMDAEDRKKELMKDNNVSDGMMFKLKWDPRIIGNRIVDGKQVTGIGEFIRSHSLDEFPQFINVLFGQMSLVGTRPPTVDEWEKYKYHHRARLATKPGITGMWQVNGRSEITDFEEVVRLDTEYINHWSIGMDIKILMRTIKVVLTKKGAM